MSGFHGLVLLAALLLAIPAAGRELRIGITQFPSNLHPNIDSMAAKSYVLGLVQRPLTTYDRDWKLVCMLCTELPTFENGGAVRERTPEGKEGVALTYRLRPDLFWGDGVPVTSEDVRFTWEVGRHPLSGVTNAELYRRIWKIDILDERSFTLHVDRVTFDYNAIGFGLLPAHRERAIFAADPATYRNRTLFDTAPTDPGLAFGPYRIVAVTPGSRIELARNPAWRGPAPAFERIIVRAIENTAALEANLLSGEIDMIDGTLGLALDQALAFEKRHRDRFTVFFKPGLVYEHIDLRLDHPILSDVRVRRALLLALDRELLVRELFEGRQPVAHSFVSPLDRMLAAELPRWPFDPERAARLLEEAGWRLGPGGIRRNARGEPLRLEFQTTAGNRSRELVQQVLQGMWRKLGIEVTIKNEPPRVLFAETLGKRRFSGMVMFAWISSPENVPRSVLHSSEIPRPENNWSGQNYTGFADPEVDALLDAIEVELDEERRRGLWHRLQTIYAEQLPALPLYFRAEAHVWPKWLQGVEPTGHLAPTT
ncbi:MAG: peptide ABC transporter substrate-binding protein, partial [Geminicoccaceae bacterium]|nr:peptide ABC transporter substrate-binding protein [Geminicoccaceae bacterium]MDW8342793.1 peptide ABC transporter substrate-binding protein [Geminicoccaceae bacterium]